MIKLLNKGMLDSLIGSHVIMCYMNSKLLGTVKGIDGKNSKRLYVEFFNGEPWPLEPSVDYDMIGVLIPEYEND